VYENRVLRRLFGFKREEVAGGHRRPHNDKLHNMYISPNTVRVMKSRRMRWMWCIACVGETRNAYSIFVEAYMEG
jgi:hypothetical protein